MQKLTFLLTNVFTVLKGHYANIIGICFLLIPITENCFADLILQLEINDCQIKGQKLLLLVILIISSIWRKQGRGKQGRTEAKLFLWIMSIDTY